MRDRLISSRWVPLWFVNWLWRYCVRCDQIRTRWHYRKCPCVVLIPEPGTPLHEAIGRLIERHRDG